MIRKVKNTDYERQVFINCPFDDQYLALFHAVVFAVHDCGYVSLCALEVIDTSESRLNRLLEIIKQCKYGVHDISRTELNAHGLPRFNMPLEPGLFLGAKKFGSLSQRQKQCLVVDCEPYRYQIFISDIAGQDIQSHENSEQKAIHVVRNWLNTLPETEIIPSGAEIWKRYQQFRRALPKLCRALKWQPDDLEFADYQYIVAEWLEANTP